MQSTALTTPRARTQVTWSCHREIIADNQPISAAWQMPARS